MEFIDKGKRHSILYAYYVPGHNSKKFTMHYFTMSCVVVFSQYYTIIPF